MLDPPPSGCPKSHPRSTLHRTTALLASLGVIVLGRESQPRGDRCARLKQCESLDFGGCHRLGLGYLIGKQYVSGACVGRGFKRDFMHAVSSAKQCQSSESRCPIVHLLEPRAVSWGLPDRRTLLVVVDSRAASADGTAFAGAWGHFSDPYIFFFGRRDIFFFGLLPLAPRHTPLPVAPENVRA